MIPRQVTGSRGDLKEFKAKVRVMMKVQGQGLGQIFGIKMMCVELLETKESGIKFFENYFPLQISIRKLLTEGLSLWRTE